MFTDKKQQKHPKAFSCFVLFILIIGLSACGAGGVNPPPISEIFQDTASPNIEIKGNKTEIIPVGGNYIDAGANASDEIDGDLSTSISIESDVDTSTEGTYTVVYTVSDGAGNITIEIRIIIVTAAVDFVDTSPPVITLIGEPSISVLLNTEYNDAGATANDNVDGDITAAITVASNIDTSKAGIYSVVYTVTDAAGSSTTAVRTVSVNPVIVDTTPPVISLLGNNPQLVEISTSYVDAGATATDAVSGDLTIDITSTNNVNTEKTGIYTVTYTVKDQAGNASIATRKVEVVLGDDIVKPIIKVIGKNVKTEKGKTYVDQGATATDDVDGDITNKIITTNSVDTNTVGRYSVKYSVEDAAGNTATKFRSVIVFTAQDTVKPIITIKGTNPVKVQLGQTYTDAGATATDKIDGNLTSSLQSSGKANTDKLGDYVITYSVRDAAGNLATTTRKVEVFNNAPTSFYQAAFNSGTSNYEYGFNSIDNVPIFGAPADTDRTRSAMLHDGGMYRLYFFKVGSNDTLYSFGYNGSSQRYEYGFNSIDILKISKMPADADATSFAVLYDGEDYRLYMLGKENKTTLYQAAYNASTQEYEYGYRSSNIAITNVPIKTDYSRWAMLHDGSAYRLYFFLNNSSTAMYQFVFNGDVYDYGGRRSIKNLSLTNMPDDSSKGNFSMLYDGATYRLYIQPKL